LPKYLSSDNDPLYRFHQWQANLRILEVTEIKSIPYVPLSFARDTCRCTLSAE
jgi:putative transposase